MNPILILRLEQKVEQLLARKSELEGEVRRLAAREEAQRKEMTRVRRELDRILAKLNAPGEKP